MARRSIRIRSLLALGVLTCAACRVAPPSAPQAEADSVGARRAAAVEAERTGFEGGWNTTFGPMSISRFADGLGGSYGAPLSNSWIEGAASARRFDFRYREPDESGEGWFELSDDGARFSGRWRADGSEEWADWNGERPGAVASRTNCAGAWSSNYGTLRLEQDGARVRGSYSQSPGSRIEGQLNAGVLRGTYEESDGTQGRVVLEFSADGEHFRGLWRAGLEPALELDDESGSTWTGRRAHPTPGRKWLVVLEANWETSLAEPPYSYGAILRAFFERAPDIQVRQRYFHDREDLVRLCRELGSLLEPVTLYISSHGSQAGVGVGAEVIDGETIGRALAGLTNLELVHFGGCELLGGDLGANVRRAAGSSFPLSGFEVEVDWAASAIVDLTYLHLVLEREMAPAEAVAALHSMLSFARSETNDDDPIAATHLTVLDAD
jgi:hypothetical protein